MTGWWSWRARPWQSPPQDGTVPVVLRGPADPNAIWELATPQARTHLAVEPVLRLSSLVMVRDAVRAGVGAARLPVSLVGGDLASGRLVQWGDVPGSAIALWALYPSRRLLSARVSAFLDLLKQTFPKGEPDELTAYMSG